MSYKENSFLQFHKLSLLIHEMVIKGTWKIPVESIFITNKNYNVLCNLC